MEKITRNTPLSRMVEEGPEVIELLLELGLHCFSCPASSFETLEQGCLGHGFSDKDVDELVERINKIKEKA